MYRAPVEEIAFTLKHVAGLRAAIEAGVLGDLCEDLVDAILARPAASPPRRSRRSARSATGRAP